MTPQTALDVPDKFIRSSGKKDVVVKKDGGRYCARCNALLGMTCDLVRPSKCSCSDREPGKEKV